jgi:hypothetical protein
VEKKKLFKTSLKEKRIKKKEISENIRVKKERAKQ